MSCRSAAQRSQRSSVFLEILSTTSSVCQKLSLWRCPSFSSTPCRATSSGRISESNPVSYKSLSPIEGLMEASILLSSSAIRSLEIILSRYLLSAIACRDFFSILKFS